MPLNVEDFAPQSTRRVKLNSIVGTIALTYNRGLTSLTLHEFIILLTLPIGTLGYNEIQIIPPIGTSGYNEIQIILPIGTSGYNIRYTSEYILKLQIHQQYLHSNILYIVTFQRNKIHK